MRALTRISFLGGVVLFAVSCGGQSPPGGLGALSSFIKIGQQGAWTGSMDGDVYWLENPSEDAAIRYYFTPVDATAFGQRTVSVDVTADAGQNSRAGLLYGYNRNPTLYYMATVEPDGTGALYRRDEDGLNVVMSGSTPPGENGFSRLEVRESGSQIEVLVNGKSIGSMGSRGTGEGAVGIIAVGPGRFGFTNYRQTPQPAVALSGGGPEAAPASGAQRGRPAQAAAAASADIVRLKRFDILDRQGFGEPVTAYSLLAPSDWRLEGGVEWTPNFRCYSELVATKARLTSPDGRFAFEFFPNYATDWWDDPTVRNMRMQALAMSPRACPIAPPHSSAEFVSRVFVPGFRRGANVVNAEQNAAVAEAAKAKVFEKEGDVIRANGMQVDTDAARVRLAYDSGGAPTEEWVLATTQRSVIPGPMVYRAAYTQDVYGFRAPRGELDANERLFSAMVASIRIHPGWDRAVRQTIQEIIRTEAAGNRAALDRVRQSSRRLFDDWNASIDQRGRDWRRTQESHDRVAEKWNLALRGTEKFVDSESNGSWEIESGYEHVWKTPLDELVLTNNPNFNPNEAFNEGGWTQLERAP